MVLSKGSEIYCSFCLYVYFLFLDGHICCKYLKELPQKGNSYESIPVNTMYIFVVK